VTEIKFFTCTSLAVCSRFTSFPYQLEPFATNIEYCLYLLSLLVKLECIFFVEEPLDQSTELHGIKPLPPAAPVVFPQQAAIQPQPFNSNTARMIKKAG
jgi:hypothetical protein